MITDSIKRYDIVYYDYGTNPGSARSGVRPVMVVQHDSFNKTSPTTIIAPVVALRKRNRSSAHVILGQRFGLSSSSMVFLDKLQTVDQEDLGELIGHVDDPELIQRIDKGLSKAMDMINVQDDSVLRLRVSTCKKKHKKKKPAYSPRDIMCLCPVCRDAYRHRGFRVLTVGGPKDLCDYCNYRTGVDYAVVGLLSR
jgi:mRNA-degrading endonuclease toxin of MazEF toxin-antitoxin module